MSPTRYYQVLNALATEALDEHGVVLHGDRAVDERVEHLVVAGGAHVEELLDGRLLGASVLPPLPLEVDDAAVTVAERLVPGLGGRGGVMDDVHVFDPSR